MNIFIVQERTAPVNSPPDGVDDWLERSPSAGAGGENWQPIYTRSDDARIVQLDDIDRTWPAFLNNTRCQRVAFGIGSQDAQDGLLCCPEMYFTRQILKEYYCRGFASVDGHTETTRWFLNKE